ncbi:MAG: hypothetical protein AB8F65_08490 [Woeseiaceae bacterium]
MNSTDKVNPPKWFKPVAVLAIAWNTMGLAAFAQQMTMDTGALPEAQRTFYESVPLWATGAFAIAVIFGTLGSIALLLRKRWSVVALALSVIGVVVQMLHSLLLGDGLAIFGNAALVLPLTTLAVGVALWVLAVSSAKKAWF